MFLVVALENMEDLGKSFCVVRCYIVTEINLEAQWLNGRVLDSRPKGRRFEPHRRHCVVFLSKDINPSLVLVQHRKTRPFITARLLMGRKESNKKKTVRNKAQKELHQNVNWQCLE